MARGDRSIRGGKIPIGDAVNLVSLTIIEQKFDITRTAATKMLSDMRIPIVYIGREAYFNEFIFEKVLYYLSRLSSTGFAAPGSEARRTKRCGTKLDEFPTIRLTDEDIGYIMDDPIFNSEFLAAGERSRRPAAASTHISKLAGRARMRQKAEVDNAHN